MKEQLITFDTAKLAKEKGFNDHFFHKKGEDSSRWWKCQYCYDPNDDIKIKQRWGEIVINSTDEKLERLVSTPTQSLLQKFIRETRGVHIEIHRNASGYYWSMCKVEGGTDLGWSNGCGSNLGGDWDSFEDALENALQVQLSYDLPNNTKVIKHWGNYVEFALKK